MWVALCCSSRANLFSRNVAGVALRYTLHVRKTICMFPGCVSDREKVGLHVFPESDSSIRSYCINAWVITSYTTAMDPLHFCYLKYSCSKEQPSPGLAGERLAP